MKIKIKEKENKNKDDQKWRNVFNTGPTSYVNPHRHCAEQPLQPCRILLSTT